MSQYYVRFRLARVDPHLESSTPSHSTLTSSQRRQLHHRHQHSLGQQYSIVTNGFRIPQAQFVGAYTHVPSRPGLTSHPHMMCTSEPLIDFRKCTYLHAYNDPRITQPRNQTNNTSTIIGRCISGYLLSRECWFYRWLYVYSYMTAMVPARHHRPKSS